MAKGQGDERGLPALGIAYTQQVYNSQYLPSRILLSVILRSQVTISVKTWPHNNRYIRSRYAFSLMKKYKAILNKPELYYLEWRSESPKQGGGATRL